MKYKKTGIIRCENDETSPEITVSTFRKCSRREVKMIKLRETEGAGSLHTNSLFQRETVLISGLEGYGRWWPGAGAQGRWTKGVLYYFGNC